MPSGKRLLEDFILPALNTQAFGHFLEWVDSNEKECFKVLYHHKNGHNWSIDSADVFVAWDKLKGRTQDTEDYFTKSRQRFRVALAKCPRLEKIPNKGDKHIEIFRILSHKKRNPKRELLPSPAENLKPEVKHMDNYKILHRSPNTAFHETVPSVRSNVNRQPVSVIVSPEHIRQQQQRRLIVEGLSGSKERDEIHNLSKIKPRIFDTEPSTQQPKPTKDLVEIPKQTGLQGVPMKMGHRIPIVPVPDRTSGIEILRCKSKTPFPQNVKYVSYDPKSNAPYLQTTSNTQHTIFRNPNLINSDQFPSTENNLSLLNIQSVQKLK